MLKRLLIAAFLLSGCNLGQEVTPTTERGGLPRFKIVDHIDNAPIKHTFDVSLEWADGSAPGKESLTELAEHIRETHAPADLYFINYRMEDDHPKAMPVAVLELNQTKLLAYRDNRHPDPLSVRTQVKGGFSYDQRKRFWLEIVATETMVDDLEDEILSKYEYDLGRLERTPDADVLQAIYDQGEETKAAIHRRWGIEEGSDLDIEITREAGRNGWHAPLSPDKLRQAIFALPGPDSN